jgi:FlaA1/EpsC-like NDP-sugar epimerase
MAMFHKDGWPRICLIFLDIALLNVCMLAALWLRFDGEPLAEAAQAWELYRLTAPWVTLLFLGFALASGLYNRIWEYASVDAILCIAVPTTVPFVALAVLSQVQDLGYSRIVLATAWLSSLLAIAGARLVWRIARTRLFHTDTVPKQNRAPILIYGAGREGALLARHARDDFDSRYDVVGYVDDNLSLRGMYVAGYKVLGNEKDLGRLIDKHQIQEIIVALPSASGKRLQEIMKLGHELGVRVRTVPRLLELIDGEVALSSVRDLKFTDLLGRDTGDLELALPQNYVAGQTILVTGAGGSIGSEICRQLCRYNPRRVILLGRGENRIHSIYYELRDRWPKIEFVPVIANLASPEAVNRVLFTHRPRVVIHAAAHKHVYLMEVNPVEAARNNVLGTSNLVDAAQEYGVDRFVLVSTDKAAEPTSVMGATKRFCERLVISQNGRSKTKFMAVRFGNVLGSAGSVLPIFQACVAAGRPLQVTHPDVDRFFMTIEEAAFLVLQAGALGNGGEIFVLDMGEPVNICSIARAVLEMNGKDADAPGAICFIGLGPGEKLHETLTAGHEQLTGTESSRILQIKTNGDAPSVLDVSEGLVTVRSAVARCDEARVLDMLQRVTNATLEGQARRPLVARVV